MQEIEKGILDFWLFLKKRTAYFNNRFLNKDLSEDLKDPMLDKFSFCNTHREYDRVTLYFIEKIALKSKNFSKEEILMNSYFLRTSNRVEYLEHLGFPFTKEQILNVDKILEKDNSYEGKRWRPAYRIAAVKTRDPNFADYNKYARLLIICKELMEKGIFEEISNVKNPVVFYEYFTVGNYVPVAKSFLAYEIYCDLALCPEFVSEEFNLNSFVNLGSGAKGGLCRIFNQDPNLVTDLFLEEAFLKLLQNQKMYIDAAKIKFPFGKTLNARNLEHSLCEYRKYIQKRKGEGRDLKSTRSNLEYKLDELKKYFKKENDFNKSENIKDYNEIIIEMSKEILL